jgi:hypothetical protein
MNSMPATNRERLQDEIQFLEMEHQKLVAAKDALEAETKKISDKKTKLEAEEFAARDRESSAKDRVLSLWRDIRAIEALRSKIPHENTLASEILLSSEIEQIGINVLESHATELLTLARKHVERKRNYCRLISLLLFFSLYVCALILQRQNLPAYDVESR